MLLNVSSPRRFLVAVTGGVALIVIMAGCVAAAGCPPIPKKDHYTVGFAQISNGNSFRLTETQSIADEAKARGYSLVQTDANDDTAKQLNDVEDLLSRGIDILAIPPREFEASAPALAAAKEKKVPVFLVDRSAKGQAGVDYVTVMSSNFINQGKMAADWIIAKTGGKGKVIELTGTPGASASIERSKGFTDAVAGTQLKIIASQSANFDQATAQQVMEQLIQSSGGDFQVVYTSADVMALGAIASMKAAGIKVGVDGGVLVVGMDGNKAALQSVMNGEMAISVETNSKFGPLLFNTIQDYLACKPIPGFVEVKDRVFDKSNVTADMVAAAQ
jgi:galactofuranose transport system substrate-binding protein